jgi:two-component system, LytTR family, response regulator
MIKAVIIDDEEGARESLANIIGRYFSEITVVAKAAGVDDAYEQINNTNPDIVFLDIEMPSGSGFSLLERFEKVNFEVIFVTAFDHYAIKAIKFSALDYLLKPVDIDDLKEAITHFKNKNRTSVSSVNTQLDVLFNNLKKDGAKKIAIPDTHGFSYIDFSEIIRCESDGNYTTFHLTGNKKIISSRTLGEYESLLESENFFRVHRSHIINLSHLVRYVKGEGGYVVMSDGSSVEVSRRKKQEFLDGLG